MKRLLALLVLAAGISLPVLADDSTPLPTNKMCPVLTDQPVDPTIFTDYQGKRVWFCCPKCRRTFLENPEPYLHNLPQFAAAAGAGQEEHSGSGLPEQPQGISRLVRFLGKFHPVVVHFPIALILAAALAEMLNMLTGRSLFGNAARYSVAIGALSTIFTVGFGWAAGAFARYPGELARVLTLHRWLGTSAGVLILLTAILSETSRRKKTGGLRASYRITLFVAALLIGVVGHFGGTLVFGPEHYTW